MRWRSWSRSRGEEELIARGYEFERAQTAVVGETAHTWTERVQIIRSEAAAESQAAALERRLEQGRGGGARPDAAAGAGPDPVHDRLGVGAGRGRRAGRARGGGAVGGELGAARDQPDQVRGPGPRRPESPQDDRMGRPLSDHDGAARRGGDPSTGWRGWAGRCR